VSSHIPRETREAEDGLTDCRSHRILHSVLTGRIILNIREVAVTSREQPSTFISGDNAYHGEFSSGESSSHYEEQGALTSELTFGAATIGALNSVGWPELE
jgi:hypothetical protein